MRIAILQYSPTLPTPSTAKNNVSIAANFSRAESLLMREERSGTLNNVDLLVLPELAFTGYNHPSLSAIAPYLEPTADGPSTRWAIRTATRLKCTVAVGYPEAATPTSPNGEGGGNWNTAYDAQITANESTIAHNSLVFVDAEGQVVAHHRKHFLYFTDDNWAKEGTSFYSGVIPIGNGGKRVKAAAGICMDINPYKFEAPWSAYEFANHCRTAKAKIVVVSMAWLTRLTPSELLEEAMRPDMDTLGYWIERFRPLLEAAGPRDEVIVVFANRTGEEGHGGEKVGAVRYAGSSAIMGMRKADEAGSVHVKIWDVMGRAQDGLLIVDTTQPAKFGVKRQAQTEEDLADEELERRAAVETKVQAR